jgi:hypothetical protein
MIRMRSGRALAGGLTVILVFAFATGAYAASIHKYSGKTSQNQPISLQTAHGYLTHLQFQINDKCPNGHLWKIHDFNFPKFRVKHGKFDQTFKAKTGVAKAQIKGTVTDHTATGTISETRHIAKEHANCSGKTTFSINRG